MDIPGQLSRPLEEVLLFFQSTRIFFFFPCVSGFFISLHHLHQQGPPLPCCSPCHLLKENMYFPSSCAGYACLFVLFEYIYSVEDSEFFYTGLLVLTIKGLLSSCPCSDQHNGLSLSVLLECEVALNAFSPGSESYLDSTISVIMFHIKSLCQALTAR